MLSTLYQFVLINNTIHFNSIYNEIKKKKKNVLCNSINDIIKHAIIIINSALNAYIILKGYTTIETLLLGIYYSFKILKVYN